MDFFGGFNGTGPYSQQQPTPRLRQAYMDLANASTGTTFRIGQMWDLMFPLEYVPQSLSHIAFPLGYGTGMIGWRYPGIMVMQELNHGSEGVKWRFDLGVFEGSWNGPGLTTNYLTAGNAGFKPQVEARITAKGSNWQVFGSTHYSKLDLHGVDGQTVTPIKSNIKSTAYEVGGMWMPGNFIVKGAVYTGTAIAQIFGDLSQFGDIKDKGGFLQVGYKFTPNWSLYGTLAASKPNENDVLRWRAANAPGLLKNRQQALSLQYTAGAYDFSVEWLHSNLDSTTANGLGRQKTSANEVTLNGNYRF
jgi:predicted porin